MTDLLHVKYDHGWINNHSTIPYMYPQYWDFYFARDRGAVAVNEVGNWRYFPCKFDSLPLPLAR